MLRASHGGDARVTDRGYETGESGSVYGAELVLRRGEPGRGSVEFGRSSCRMWKGDEEAAEKRLHALHYEVEVALQF